MKSLFLASAICLIGLTNAGIAGESAHKHHHHHHKNIDASSFTKIPTLALKVEKDAAKGWNVQLVTENFRFAPEHVNQDPKEGEGHAHLYVGDKKTRLYANWIHLGELPPGEYKIKATLNANNHANLAVGDQPIEATYTLKVE